LVNAQHGTLAYARRADGGSRFIIELPVARLPDS
jgi:K+-sensing histidine kinase KdpD